MKRIANEVCIVLRKQKPLITVAASIHFCFGSCQKQQLTRGIEISGKFSIVQNKLTIKVSKNRCVDFLS